jgi:hypothetical protein
VRQDKPACCRLKTAGKRGQPELGADGGGNGVSLNLVNYMQTNTCIEMTGTGVKETHQVQADPVFPEYGITDSDSRVRAQTRFFAAASAVSQALANLASPWRPNSVVSDQTAAFLENIGQDLKKMNSRTIAAIQDCSLSGPGLDSQLVHMEQTEVQSQLDDLRRTDTDRYNQTVAEINSALNPASGSITAFATSHGFDTDSASLRSATASARTLAGISTSQNRVIAKP